MALVGAAVALLPQPRFSFRSLNLMMSIAFRCIQCGKLLWQDDDAARRETQCPQCGTIHQGADSSRRSDSSILPLSPQVACTSSSAPTDVVGEGSSVNTDWAPVATAHGRAPNKLIFRAAIQQVSGPAIALIVTAMLGFVTNLLIGGLYGMLLVMLVAAGDIPSIGALDDPAQLITDYGILVAVAVFGLVMDAFILVGATRMKRLDNYTFALTASILAVISRISPCCFVGVPFGIWAIMVLKDSSIKAAFQDRVRHP
jgi:phage FluMu protein Com